MIRGNALCRKLQVKYLRELNESLIYVATIEPNLAVDQFLSVFYDSPGIDSYQR